MKAIEHAFRPGRMALIIAAAGLMPLAANAQGASMSEMQARYKEDIQRCATITDPESKKTCRREAGAAIHEARNNRLVRGNVDPAANAAARCQRLPGDQRADCERLMRDGSAVEHGSVSGGGVLREMTITVPADSTAPAGTYGSQTAPAGTYGTPSTPGYGAQPVPGAAPVPPASGSYRSQPAPSTQGSYGTQPAPGSYGTQPAPAAPSGYGTQPMR